MPNNIENRDFWREHIAKDPFYDGEIWLDAATGIPYQADYNYIDDNPFKTPATRKRTPNEFIKQVKKERTQKLKAIKSFNKKHRLPSLTGSPRAAYWAEQERYQALASKDPELMNLAKDNPDATTADFWIKFSQKT